MSNVLTEALILEKTKVASLADVHHLNLWGEGLTDVSVISQLTQVSVLALAANQISTLKPFTDCANLEELYLRKNAVASLREVTALKDLKKLRTLWLLENPCARNPYYREFVLHCCQNLKQLDSVEVTADERAAAIRKLTPRVLDEILGRRLSSSPSGTSTARQTPSSAAPPQPPQPPKRTVSPYSELTSPHVLEERTMNGGTLLFTTVQAQRAMLTSIVSLLPELTVESLELLEREVHDRAERQRQKLAREKSP